MFRNFEGAGTLSGYGIGVLCIGVLVHFSFGGCNFGLILDLKIIFVGDSILNKMNDSNKFISVVQL